MAKRISEKDLESIITEASGLALEKLSVLSESKNKITDKKIDEAVSKSLRMVLCNPKIK